MRYFDSHAHYDDSRFDEDRDALLELDFSVVNPGIDEKTSALATELANKYKNVYAALGIHPHNAEKVKKGYLERLKSMLSPKTVAIGEIGLDYYYMNSEKEAQRKVFSELLDFAHNLELPVIIHSRSAAQETMELITASPVRRGVLHCFSGHINQALEYIKMGFYIGIGGPITFKNAKKTVETVKLMPLDRLLLETDAPYLSPEPFRGKRNDSRNLKYIAKTIAEIKKTTEQEIIKITYNNAVKLFKI